MSIAHLNNTEITRETGAVRVERCAEEEYCTSCNRLASAKEVNLSQLYFRICASCESELIRSLRESNPQAY